MRDLGPERSTRSAQAAFLTDLSTKFQKIVSDALAARTGGSEIFTKNPDLKIAPLTVTRMEAFAKHMALLGHTHPLRSPAEHEAETDNGSDHGSDGDISIPTTQEIDFPELKGVLYADAELQKRELTDADAFWLEELYTSNRGFELGTFDPAILSSAMREQTLNWPLLSHKYTNDIIVIVHKFIHTALKLICKDARLQTNLYNYLEANITKRYERAKEQVDFILKVELDARPLTLNPYFNENLRS